MFFADPYAVGVPFVRPSTLDPVKARKFCEELADALCPAWRKDGTVATSIPKKYDQQTHTNKEVPATTGNFYYWVLDRSKTDGLIRWMYVCWGQEAVDQAAAAKDPIKFQAGEYPIWINIHLNASRVSVAGDKTKRGTTAFRLESEIAEVCFNNVGVLCFCKTRYSVK